MKLFTIGFTKKPAERFFGLLERAGVARVVDVRLNNVSQLAGFAKRDDLAYFARALCGIDYVHRLDLAPTQAMLDRYRGGGRDWAAYEREFRALIAKRAIERTLPRELVDGACLLCSEDRPHHCHRRVVAEYLRERWGDVAIEHLG
jgi:uncharacterized protein (DUF488 family)